MPSTKHGLYLVGRIACRFTNGCRMRKDCERRFWKESVGAPSSTEPVPPKPIQPANDRASTPVLGVPGETIVPMTEKPAAGVVLNEIGAPRVVQTPIASAPDSSESKVFVEPIAFVPSNDAVPTKAHTTMGEPLSRGASWGLVEPFSFGAPAEYFTGNRGKSDVIVPYKKHDMSDNDIRSIFAQSSWPIGPTQPFTFGTLSSAEPGHGARSILAQPLSTGPTQPFAFGTLSTAEPGNGTRSIFAQPLSTGPTQPFAFGASSSVGPVLSKLIPRDTDNEKAPIAMWSKQMRTLTKSVVVVVLRTDVASCLQITKMSFGRG